VTTASGLSVVVRTSLLHRMMIIRELTGECRRAARLGDCRLPSIVERDTEAAVVGIVAALGPLDTLTASARPPAWRLSGPRTGSRPAPLTIWLDDRATRDTGQSLSALFSRLQGSTVPEVQDVAGITVDGGNVEAVLVAARHAAHLARVHVPQLLQLVNGGPEGSHDPIAALSCRLMRDRQLDDNALDAIGRDARRVAVALSGTDLRPAARPGRPPVSHGLQVGPQFLQDFAAYVRQLSSASPILPGTADPVRR
jgi:hypothetical protein